MESSRHLAISLLGSFRVSIGGQPLDSFRSSKALALLFYLLVETNDHAAVRISRDGAMTLLWPEMPQKSAKANLRQTLYLLRQAIPSVSGKAGALVPFVLSDRQHIWINPVAAYQLDIDSFDTLIREGGRLQLERAVTLYQGDLLADFYLPDSNPFEEWASQKRVILQGEALGALEQLATHYLEEERGKKAVAYARRQLEIDELRESAIRQLMKALALSGQRNEALAYYEKWQERLRQELNVEPTKETQALALALQTEEKPEIGIEKASVKMVASGPDTFLATDSKDIRRLRENDAESIEFAQELNLVTPRDIPRDNLPAAATPFVGREQELATLDKLIADPQVRIITIFGPGGSGKTRLALEAAGQALSAAASDGSTFPDGYFFVSLAALDSAGELVKTLGSALDFLFPDARQDPRSETQQILDYLEHKQMLLIMDNFEHIQEGRILLTELSERAAGIKLLVTSRERLQLRREQLLTLKGLALPSAVDSAAGAGTDYAAAELFMNIARRSVPDFQLLAGDAVQLLRICRLVEGMPLALELAASWVGLLPLSAIAAEIEQTLQFLSAEHHDVPQRHRSMHAALDTSWSRLNAEQRRAFQELTVFRGGFTRTAAVEVAGATLPLLTTLLNKSWLAYDRERDRYTIHELLRQYGGDKMRADPSHENVARDRHSAFYCRFLQEHNEKWHTNQQLETLAAVTQEEQNVRRALRWALAQENWQRIDQAIDSWGWYHDWQGSPLDRASFFKDLLDKAEAQDATESDLPPDCLRAWARALAWVNWIEEDLESAFERTEQSLALLERPELSGHDIRRDKAFVRSIYARFLVETAPDEARLLYEELLKEYRKLGDQWGIAESLAGIARVDFDTGHFASALKGLQGVDRIFRERGDRREQAVNLSMLAFTHLDLGHLDEAERHHRQSLELTHEIDYRRDLTWFQANLARTLLWQGKLEESYQLAEEALATSQELGNQTEEINARLTISGVQTYAGRYEHARRQVASVLPLVGEEGNADRARIYHTQGILALIESSYDEAQSAFASSMRIWQSTYPHHFMPASAALALATLRLGQFSQARQHLAQALSSALRYQSVTPALAALPVAALARAATGDVTGAVEMWALARHHPFIASSKWFEDVLGKDVNEWAAELPIDAIAAAQERGQALDLWETVGELVRELKSMEP
jgi:DNA-binding SARP family transcriptional activator/predicted ATPase